MLSMDAVIGLSLIHILNAFACWRNVEATAGKILVVYQFEVWYLNTTLLGYLIIMILLLSHISVSYTHLDVYKRQMKSWEPRSISVISLRATAKIGIIGAMIINPKVLLLDEPFNYLDPSSQMTLSLIHISLIGHCLVWHSQPPKWMFTDDKGNLVSREVLIGRMYNHIMNVVTHYKRCV